MAKLEGATEIHTDIKEQACSFRVPEDFPMDELKTKLDEMAKSNEHLAEFEFVADES